MPRGAQMEPINQESLKNVSLVRHILPIKIFFLQLSPGLETLSNIRCMLHTSCDRRMIFGTDQN